MYLVEWHIMDGGFGLTEELEGAKGKRAGLGCERRFVENLADSRQIAAVRMCMAWRVIVWVFVMMIVGVIMRMGMIVRRVGILAADQHARLARADAAAVYRIKDEG
jgi:hypothetical protein